ncbi:MAG: thioether cross-link-forming SCIFF peptide maturase [Oscillospiraceae bacterium]|jgi:uncharacterized protein|nr:thioether cross-link-forming SCIFF peptide maturase [Oscillospiraceae bacterium]
MVHKYHLNGYYIVVDSNSGCVHVVDRIVFDLLDRIKEPLTENLPQEMLFCLDYDLDVIKDAYSEIFKLFTQGQLFSAPQAPNTTHDEMGKIPVKAACFHVSHDCDLRCRYCFAGTGSFGGKRTSMSFEVGQKGIDFLVKRSLNRRNIEVDFFGGEPLLNFDVVKRIVDYAKRQGDLFEKDFRFTFTTNGCGLDAEKVAFINREMSNVVLSLDGRKETNDRMRVFTNGVGCYDAVLPKFKELVNRRGGKDYYIRGTFTRKNLDFSKDILHLVDEGFNEVSLEPVVLDETHPYALTERDLPQIFKEYELLAEEMVCRAQQGRGFNFFQFAVVHSESPCLSKRLMGCGAGVEYVAFVPEGDIYPCHQFVGLKSYVMGNLFDDFFDTSQQLQFANLRVNRCEKCRNCWARLYCGGGCNANNLRFEKDVSRPHECSCQMLKKRLECAFMVKSATCF